MNKGLLIPALLCASINCQANDYFFDPVFNSNERYNSNLFMVQTPQQGNWISTFSPGINAGLRHANGQLLSNFTWNENIYDNQSELNVAEQLFSLNYQHKHELLNWGFAGSYNNQSSINSESTISGLLLTQVMSKRLNLAPTATYSFNEKNSLTTSYSYNKVTYDSTTNNVYLTNYDYHQASGTFNHLYTEYDKLNATLSASLYKTQTQSTNNNVAQVGWQHSFSQQLVTNISAGVNYSKVESTQQIPGHCANTSCFPPRLVPASSVTTNKTSFGQVYQASIQKTFEKGSVSLVGSQNQSPTSVGLQTQTSLTLSPSYTLNERWTSGLSASYNKTDMTGVTNSPYNRTGYTISPNINWQWTPEIKLGLSYIYQEIQYQSSNLPSQGNITQLQFSYQPQINHQVK